MVNYNHFMDLSSVKRLDSHISTSSVISGQTKATWDIEIVEDALLESSENFNIYISDPVNAIIGRKNKLRIRLINAVGGK